MVLTHTRQPHAPAAAKSPRRWIARFAILLALPASLQADTLYLRNGTRIQGELIAMRNGQIEFEERRGFGAGRTVRIDRDEVDRIDFESSRYGNNNNSNNSNNNNNNNNNNSSGGRPSGMRERQTVVNATNAWTDTGIDVRAGQTIYVEAQGRVRWGRDRQDGPGGENNSPSNPNRPMGNRNAAALIGKIGNDMFFIGDETGAIRVRNSGRLQLGINDDVLTDNSGNFRVVVYY
jgi:hypothetical protein